MSILSKIKGLLKPGEKPPFEEEYIEIDLSKDLGKKAKIVVQPFVLREFEDVDAILNSLREGYTIALVDIAQLKNKDIVELKRAISRIKKTSDALEGSIAGFGENLIIVTPPFVRISRGEKTEKVEKLEGQK